jgi:hypothetical protein
MAELVKINIEGIPEFLIKVKLLEEKTRANIKVAMMQAVGIIQSQAKLNITNKVWHTQSKSGYTRGKGRVKQRWATGAAITGHIQQGDLRRSIKVKAGYSSQNVLEGVIGTDVPYAGYVEAHREGGFLEPALLEKQDEAWAWFQKGFRAAIIGNDLKGPPAQGEGEEA